MYELRVLSARLVVAQAAASTPSREYQLRTQEYQLRTGYNCRGASFATIQKEVQLYQQRVKASQEVMEKEAATPSMAVCRFSCYSSCRSLIAGALPRSMLTADFVLRRITIADRNA